MESGEEGHEKTKRCGTGRKFRNEGRRVESFHNPMFHRLTWGLVSMHSESANWKQNSKTACEAERDLLQREGE